MYVAHCISIRSSIETFLKLIDVHTLSFSRQAGGGKVFEGNEYSKKKRRHNTQGQMSSYVALDLAYQESTTLFVDSREKKEAS